MKHIEEPIRPASAFTLVEMMVTVAVFSMVVVVMMSAHAFGAKMLGITSSKILAGSESRKIGGRLLTEIREAKKVRVGEGNETRFMEAAIDAPQAGNALEIYATTNNLAVVRYFLDGNGNLKRWASTEGKATTIASEIANTKIFSLEDFKGTLLTNTQNNPVVRLDIRFRKNIYSMRQDAGFRVEQLPFQARIARRMIE